MSKMSESWRIITEVKSMRQIIDILCKQVISLFFFSLLVLTHRTSVGVSSAGSDVNREELGRSENSYSHSADIATSSSPSSVICR